LDALGASADAEIAARTALLARALAVRSVPEAKPSRW